jgi:hypothetical protein
MRRNQPRRRSALEHRSLLPPTVVALFQLAGSRSDPSKPLRVMCLKHMSSQLWYMTFWRKKHESRCFPSPLSSAMAAAFVTALFKYSVIAGLDPLSPKHPSRCFPEPCIPCLRWQPAQTLNTRSHQLIPVDFACPVRSCRRAEHRPALVLLELENFLLPNANTGFMNQGCIRPRKAAVCTVY